MFEKFLKAFPPDLPPSRISDPSIVAVAVRAFTGRAVPDEIMHFWSAVGCGYFADQELYVFGDSERPRDSLLSWNQKDFWADLYPIPVRDRPFFFAETCFGEQIGYRYSGSDCLAVLFIVDTMEAFVLGPVSDLFATVLTDRYAITDPIRLAAVRARLGGLAPGLHFAPILSPLAGGSGSAENFHTETPNVHFRTALATFRAMAGTHTGA